MNRAWALILSGLSLVASIEAFPQAQSTKAADSRVEDIYIGRSVPESMSSTSEFCAEARTGFPIGAGREYHYSLRSTATRGSDGLMINTNVKAIGRLHACFGSTAEPMVLKFYAEGVLGSTTFKGRGECVYMRKGPPEEGLSPKRCFLDLYDLSNAYVGGLLTMNSLESRASVGEVSLPPGYTQAGIFTVRLWKRR
jgi:hypothetical protein